MPSPFPGMDPYLENPAVWPGFRDRLNVYLAELLQPLLRPGQYVDIRERPSPDYSRDTYLEIASAADSHAITVIEVISPVCKMGTGRERYLAMRDQGLASGLNLVEIDLLRRGSPVVAIPPEAMAALPPFDYLVCVSRAAERGKVEVYRATLRDPLPVIGIPLGAGEEDVALDLGAAVTRVYDAGAYGQRLDYRLPPEEPFHPADEEWADALLRQAGYRREERER
ncbi:MAG: DUF4058 family protein [Armatimonadota bacterium]|nr:DUF4058 family protein [Armatimonadota bacterium]